MSKKFDASQIKIIKDFGVIFETNTKRFSIKIQEYNGNKVLNIFEEWKRETGTEWNPQRGFNLPIEILKPFLDVLGSLNEEDLK